MSRVRRGREWVLDIDPETLLTVRQRQVLDAVRAYGGNRSRAAQALGVPVQAVQDRLKSAAARGVSIPPGSGRGPDLYQRTRTR